MTTIPADILEIARELASLCGDSDQARYDRRDDIAAALMAERERCAQISIAMCSHRLPAWADDIAAAIRKGTP